MAGIESTATFKIVKHISVHKRKSYGGIWGLFGLLLELLGVIRVVRVSGISGLLVHVCTQKQTG